MQLVEHLSVVAGHSTQHRRPPAHLTEIARVEDLDDRLAGGPHVRADRPACQLIAKLADAAGCRLEPRLGLRERDVGRARGRLGGLRRRALRIHLRVERGDGLRELPVGRLRRVELQGQLRPAPPGFVALGPVRRRRSGCGCDQREHKQADEGGEEGCLSHDRHETVRRTAGAGRTRRVGSWRDPNDRRTQAARGRDAALRLDTALVEMLKGPRNLTTPSHFPERVRRSAPRARAVMLARRSRNAPVKLHERSWNGGQPRKRAPKPSRMAGRNHCST